MIRRGALCLVALSGDYGKPRPALVVQADIAQSLTSRIVCPLTSDVQPDRDYLRPIVEPTAENGLRERSQIMVDKPHAISADKLVSQIGVLDARTLRSVNRALILLLDLA